MRKSPAIRNATAVRATDENMMLPVALAATAGEASLT